MYERLKIINRFISLILVSIFVVSAFPIQLAYEVFAASGGSSSSSGGGAISGGGGGATPHESGIAFNSCLYLYPCIQAREQYTKFGIDGSPFLNKTRNVWPVAWDTSADKPVGTFFVVEAADNIIHNPKYPNIVYDQRYGAWTGKDIAYFSNPEKIYFNGGGSNATASDWNSNTRNALSNMLNCEWNAGAITKSNDEGAAYFSVAKDLSTDAVIALKGLKYPETSVSKYMSDLSYNDSYNLPKTREKINELVQIHSPVNGIRFWAEIPADEFVKFGKRDPNQDDVYRQEIVENAIANAYLVQAYYVASNGSIPKEDLDSCLVDCLNYWSGTESEYEYIPIFEQAVGCNISTWANIMFYMPIHDWMGLATPTSSVDGTLEQFASDRYFRKGKGPWINNSEKVSAPSADDIITITKFAWWTLMRYTMTDWSGSGLGLGNGVTYSVVSLYRKDASGEGYNIPEIVKYVGKGEDTLNAHSIIGFGTIAAPPGSGSPPTEAQGQHRLIASFETSQGGQLKGMSSNYDWQGSPVKTQKVTLGDTCSPAGTNIEFTLDTSNQNLSGIADQIIESGILPEAGSGEEGEDSGTNLYLNYAEVTLKKSKTEQKGENTPVHMSLDSSGGTVNSNDTAYEMEKTYYPLYINAGSNGSGGGTAKIPTESKTLSFNDVYYDEGTKSAVVIKLTKDSYYQRRGLEPDGRGGWKSVGSWGSKHNLDEEVYVMLKLKGATPENSHSTSYAIIEDVIPINKPDLSNVGKGKVVLQEKTTGNDVKFVNDYLHTALTVEHQVQFSASGTSFRLLTNDSNRIQWYRKINANEGEEFNIGLSWVTDDYCLPNSTPAQTVIDAPDVSHPTEDEPDGVIEGGDIYTGSKSALLYAPNGSSQTATVVSFGYSGNTISTQTLYCSSPATYTVDMPAINNKTGKLKIEQSSPSGSVYRVAENVTKADKAKIIAGLQLLTKKYLVKNAPMVINYSEFDEVGSYIWNYESTMSLVFTVGDKPGTKVLSSEPSNCWKLDMGTSKDSVALSVAAQPIIAEWHNKPVAFTEVKQGQWTSSRGGEDYEVMQGVPTFDDKNKQMEFYVNVGGTPLFIGVEAEMDTVKASREWTFLAQYKVHKHKHGDEGSCECSDRYVDAPPEIMKAEFEASYWNLRHLVVKPAQDAILSGYNIAHRDSGDGMAFYAPIFEPVANSGIEQSAAIEGTEAGEMIIDFTNKGATSSIERANSYDKLKGVKQYAPKPTTESTNFKFNGHDVGVEVEYIHFNNVVSGASEDFSVEEFTHSGKPYEAPAEDTSSESMGDKSEDKDSSKTIVAKPGDGSPYNKGDSDYAGDYLSDAFGVTLASGSFRGDDQFYNAPGAIKEVKYHTFEDQYAFVNSDSCVVTITVDGQKMVYPILKGFSCVEPLIYKSSLHTTHPTDCCGCDKQKLLGSLGCRTTWSGATGKLCKRENVLKYWYPSDLKHKDAGSNVYDWPIWSPEYAVPTIGYNGHPDNSPNRNNSYNICKISDDHPIYELIRWDKEDYKNSDSDDDHASWKGYGQVATADFNAVVNNHIDLNGSPVNITNSDGNKGTFPKAGVKTTFEDLYLNKEYMVPAIPEKDLARIRFVSTLLPNGRYDFLSSTLFQARNGKKALLYENGPKKLDSADFAGEVDETTGESKEGLLSSGLNIACRLDFGNGEADDKVDSVVDKYIYNVNYFALEYLDYRDPVYTSPNMKTAKLINPGWFTEYPEWTDVEDEGAGGKDYTRNLYASEEQKINRVVRQGINPIIIHNPISVQDTYISYSDLQDQRDAYNPGQMEPNFIDTGFTLHIGTGIDLTTLDNLSRANTEYKAPDDSSTSESFDRTAGLLFSNMYDGGSAKSTPAEVDYFIAENSKSYSFTNRHQADRANYIYGDNYGIVGKGYTSSLDSGKSVIPKIYSKSEITTTNAWKDSTSSSRNGGTSKYIANIIIEVPINVIYNGAIGENNQAVSGIKVGDANITQGTYIPAGTTLTIHEPQLANYNLHFVVAPDQKDVASATFNIVAQAKNDPGNAINTPYMERYQAVKAANNVVTLNTAEMRTLLKDKNLDDNARKALIPAFAFRTCLPANITDIDKKYSKQMQYESNLIRAGMNTAAHWASKTMAFDVVGRIGNIAVDDVEDPNFQKTFRENNQYVTTMNDIFNIWKKKILNQTQTLGKYHTVDKANNNYLPVTNEQSSDKISFPKLGYEFNYSVQTIGGYDKDNLVIKPTYSIEQKIVDKIFYNTGNNSYTKCYQRGEEENAYHIYKDYGSPRSKVNLRTGASANISEVLGGYNVDENGTLTPAKKDDEAATNRIVNIGTLDTIKLSNTYNMYADGNTHILTVPNYQYCNIKSFIRSGDTTTLEPAETWPAKNLTSSKDFASVYKGAGENHQRWTGSLKLPSSSVFYDKSNQKITLTNKGKDFSKLLIRFDITTPYAERASIDGISTPADWRLRASTENQVTSNDPNIPQIPDEPDDPKEPKDPDPTSPEVKLIEGTTEPEFDDPDRPKKPIPIILFDVTQTSATDLSITGTH